MELGSPITAVVTCVVNRSTRHLNYLRALEKNLNKLKQEMAQLNERKEDVNNKVIAEQEQLKKPTHQVQGWMQRVVAKKHKVDEILPEGRQLLERRRLRGCCPNNCWSSYKLGKKVVKNLKLVKELNSKGVFEIVSEKPHRTQVQELPENFTVGLDSIFEEVVNLLGKYDVQVLGLCRVGGVGKTTLLKKINNDLPKRNNDFDIVIWVVISTEPNMGTVQAGIRERLGLMPWHESVSSSSRASDVFNALKKMKFLILLDDVWKEINLLSIGIPLPSVQKRSKIVLTMRSLDVCGAMKVDYTIDVKSLNQEESWILFKKNVGQQTLNADPEIPMLAEKVTEKWHGLPIVLITVGSSMASKKNPREWKSAISDSNKSAAKFPEDQSIGIEVLIDRWIGAGYISGFEDYEEALNRGHSIIGTLKRTCFLEKGLVAIFVKMHDMIREFALWIAGECGKEEVVQEISLMDTNIIQLESLPSCPNLSIFFAPTNLCLNHIVDDFFLSAPALKFFDLRFSKITKVPTSICELFELEFLDLSHTKFTSLPYEIRNLIKLKYLSFASMELLRIIPRGMMMNFSNLEILKLQVPKSGDSDEEMHVNIFDELQCLNQLKALDISISDFKDLEKFVSEPRLCNFTRVLCVQWCKEITPHSSLGHFKKLRYLAIRDCSELKEWFFDCITNNNGTEVGLFEGLEIMLLENLPKLDISWDLRNLHFAHLIKLRFVYLLGCAAMVDLTWLLLIPNLQSLRIEDCCGLQEILSSSDESGS